MRPRDTHRSHRSRRSWALSSASSEHGTHRTLPKSRPRARRHIEAAEGRAPLDDVHADEDPVHVAVLVASHARSLRRRNRNGTGVAGTRFSTAAIPTRRISTAHGLSYCSARPGVHSLIDSVMDTSPGEPAEWVLVQCVEDHATIEPAASQFAK